MSSERNHRSRRQKKEESAGAKLSKQVLACSLALREGMLVPEDLEEALVTWDGKSSITQMLHDQMFLRSTEKKELETQVASQVTDAPEKALVRFLAESVRLPIDSSENERETSDGNASATQVHQRKHEPTIGVPTQAPVNWKWGGTPIHRFVNRKPASVRHRGQAQVEVAVDGDFPKSGEDYTVILKTPKGAEGWDLFRQEAETTAKLHHPGIPTVVAYNRGNGYEEPFYAMERVRGQTLLPHIEWLHQGNFSERNLRRILPAFSRICRTVHYAHERKIVHSDIKSANVMLGEVGKYEEGHAYVVDWGMAKPIGKPMVGFTPYYVPPEQEAAMRVDKEVLASPAQDIYSLGASLFELLTGRLPERSAANTLVLDSGQNSQSANIQLERQRHFQNIYRRITGKNAKTQSLRDFEPRVPRPLDNICLKAIATNPSERYQSAKEFADDIDRWIQQDKVHAQPEHPADKAKRLTSRNPGWMVITAIFLALLAASFYRTSLIKDDLGKKISSSALALVSTVQNREIDGNPITWGELAIDEALNFHKTVTKHGLELEGIDPVKLEFKSGWIEEMKGESSKAELIYSKLVSKCKDRTDDLLVRVHFALGRVAMAQGKNPRAHFIAASKLGTHPALEARVNLAAADIFDAQKLDESARVAKLQAVISDLDELKDSLASDSSAKSLELQARANLQLTLARLHTGSRKAVVDADIAIQAYKRLKDTAAVDPNFHWETRHAWEQSFTRLLFARTLFEKAKKEPDVLSSAILENELAGKELYATYNRFYGNPDYARGWGQWCYQESFTIQATQATVAKLGRILWAVEKDLSRLSHEEGGFEALNSLATEFRCETVAKLVNTALRENNAIQDQINAYCENECRQAIEAFKRLSKQTQQDKANLTKFRLQFLSCLLAYTDLNPKRQSEFRSVKREVDAWLAGGGGVNEFKELSAWCTANEEAWKARLTARTTTNE